MNNDLRIPQLIDRLANSHNLSLNLVMVAERAVIQLERGGNRKFQQEMAIQLREAVDATRKAMGLDQ